MANSKISALTAATTPVAGTEVLPIVQSSATVKLAISDITPGLSTITATKGGTGLTSFTTNGVLYASSTTALTTSAFLLFDGRTLGIGGAVLAGWGGAYGRAQIGTGLSMYSNSASVAIYGANIYNAGAGVIRYINTGSASQYAQSSGGHTWSTASSGIAGDVVTFATQMTLNAASVLSVGSDISSGTGNFIPSTAAKGVNFTANTPLAGMTSQLLNWYEEGTWTPNQGGGLTLVGAFSSTGKYTRVGRNVTVSGTVTGATSVAVTAAGVITTNLPFTAGTAGHGNATNAAITSSAAVICTSTSVTSAGAIAATGTITFSATYFV